MNYKRIGPDSWNANRLRRWIYWRTHPQPEAFLSSCAFFTEDTARSFSISTASFLPCGSPRNDLFFSDMQSISGRIRAEYGIPKGSRVVLYAPTFRKGNHGDVFDLDTERLRDALVARFGGEWTIFFRWHYYIQKESPFAQTDSVDVTQHSDMQELLCATDVLISDYSSCMWDFSFTGRPVFVYAPDVDVYREKDRSFAYPLEKWPYAVTKSNDELAAAILSFDEKAFRERIKAHHTDAVAYENGTACEQVAALLAQHMEKQSLF